MPIHLPRGRGAALGSSPMKMDMALEPFDAMAFLVGNRRDHGKA